MRLLLITVRFLDCRNSPFVNHLKFLLHLVFLVLRRRQGAFVVLFVVLSLVILCNGHLVGQGVQLIRGPVSNGVHQFGVLRLIEA